MFYVDEIDDIEALQDADEQCTTLKALLRRNNLNDRQQQSTNNFKLVDNTLYKRVKIDKQFKYVTIAPTAQRTLILDECDDKSAHLGVEKTKDCIKGQLAQAKEVRRDICEKLHPLPEKKSN